MTQTIQIGEYLWQVKYHLTQAFERNSQGFIGWLEWFYHGIGIAADEEGNILFDDKGNEIDLEPTLIDSAGGKWLRGRTKSGLCQAVYLGRYVETDKGEESRSVRSTIRLLAIEQNPHKNSEGARLVAEGFDVVQIILNILSPGLAVNMDTDYHEDGMPRTIAEIMGYGQQRVTYSEYWARVVAMKDECQLHFYRGMGLNEKE